MLKIGVLAIQGDVSEHISAVEKTLNKFKIRNKIQGKVIEVKFAEDIATIDALIIPGGESTTIGKLLAETKLVKEIKKRAGKIPIMGTCAGLILLGKLNLMNINVKRNAFGRQRESFETEINSKIGKFHGIFIRAPVIESAGKEVEILAKYDGKIVMARQDKILAVAFHPELTDDTKIYEYFLGLIE